MNQPSPVLPTLNRQVLKTLYKRTNAKGVIYGSISMELGLGAGAVAEELCKLLLDHRLAELKDNRIQITQLGEDWINQFLQIQEERILESLFSDYNFTLLRFLYDQDTAVDFSELPTILADHAPKNTTGYPSMNLYHMLDIELKPYIEQKGNKYQLNISGRRYVEVRAKEINISLYSKAAAIIKATSTEMNLKQEKEQRNQFLKSVYMAARKECPTSPTSVLFGLSKYKKYNFKTGELHNNDEKRGGYIIGEALGLSEETVDSFVNHLCDNSVGYLGSFIGMGQFHITQLGIMYLESLENEATTTPIQFQHNSITIGEINSPFQLQQASTHASQHQAIQQNPKAIINLLEKLEKDIQQLPINIRSDFQMEINYARKQLDRSNPVIQQLENIGKLMKDVGLNVFANVLASPIYEAIKPILFS